MSRSGSSEVRRSRAVRRTHVPQHPEVRDQGVRDQGVRDRGGLDPPRTFRGLQTPRRWTCDRYSALTSGDSPGDEVLQDIIWDPTSPPQPPLPGGGPRAPRVVKISDLVNRIAPKDVRPAPSPLLQWMGDGGVSCTPDGPTPPAPRARRRSVRQSSVDGLVELARAFDRNMERADAPPRPHGDQADAPPPPPPPPSESQRVEAELRALFDCSTQGASGALSGGVSQGPTGGVQDFEDDWEDDDLLNDSLVVAMTLEAEPKATPPGARPGAGPSPSPSPSHPRGPPRTPQRSTFRLEPNPRRSLPPPPAASTNHTPPLPPTRPQAAQAIGMRPVTTATAVTETKPVTAATPVTTVTEMKPVTTVTKMKPVTTVTEMKPVTTVTPVTEMMKPVTEMKPVTTATPVTETEPVTAATPQPTGGWDEGGDDLLLLQVCEDAERLSHSQPQATPTGGRGQPQATPAAIGGPAPRPLGRSNSLPAGGGGGGGAGTAGGGRGGGVRTGGAGVTADQWGTSRHSGNSQHATFKRHLSDPASTASSKASWSGQVTSQLTGQLTSRCSAAEIERKKQEALARKRQRMQNSQHETS